MEWRRGALRRDDSTRAARVGVRASEWASIRRRNCDLKFKISNEGRQEVSSKGHGKSPRRVCAAERNDVVREPSIDDRAAFESWQRRRFHEPPTGARLCCLSGDGFGGGYGDCGRSG